MQKTLMTLHDFGAATRRMASEAVAEFFRPLIDVRRWLSDSADEFVKRFARRIARQVASASGADQQMSEIRRLVHKAEASLAESREILAQAQISFAEIAALSKPLKGYAAGIPIEIEKKPDPLIGDVAMSVVKLSGQRIDMPDIGQASVERQVNVSVGTEDFAALRADVQGLTEEIERLRASVDTSPPEMTRYLDEFWSHPDKKKTTAKVITGDTKFRLEGLTKGGNVAPFYTGRSEVPASWDWYENRLVALGYQHALERHRELFEAGLIPWRWPVVDIDDIAKSMGIRKQ